MRDIELFAKNTLEAAVRIGVPKGLGGVSEQIETPEFATSVGLAMLAAEESRYIAVKPKNGKKGPKKAKNGNFLKKILAKF